jgi:hypothetical protein
MSTSSQEPGFLQNTTEGISNMAQNVSQGIGQGLDAAKSNVDQAVNNFSSNESVQASSSFLSANTIVAKFAFLILVIVGFLVLFNLGIWLIGYFMSTNQNPYLVQGKLNPKDGALVISQNPAIKGSIPIPRSNNAITGIEFTWSVWLLYNPPADTSTGVYQPVFVKGDYSVGNNTIFSSVNNAPGVYFGPTSNKTPEGKPIANSLWILMDTVTTPSSESVSAKDGTEYIEIQQVPIDKFFHLAIRCQNKYIDVYINGTIVFRKNLVNVPKQNYYNVNICPSSPFDGYLSDLRYFSRALTVIDINNIVLKGPNMNTAKTSASSKQYTGSNYLSSMWYGKFLK